jgi:hypothetical protein
MRRVELDALIESVPAETVYDNILRFDRYPALAPHVEATTVHETVPASTGKSSWELHFRSGLLRWTERETFKRDELRLEFEQISGDFTTRRCTSRPTSTSAFPAWRGFSTRSPSG